MCFVVSQSSSDSLKLFSNEFSNKGHFHIFLLYHCLDCNIEPALKILYIHGHGVSIFVNA